MAAGDPLVVAIDCSTSAAKAVVVARNGDVCASGRQPIPPAHAGDGS
ncbi:MAG: hypothetical protein LKI58_01390 [Actinomyces sp.]|nr:hypothetical protein [Actinomyces sp.]MCI1786711.1 hypothetical protein [Actinomyces sp.]